MNRPLAQWLMQPWRARALALAAAGLATLAWIAVAPGSLQQLDERSTDHLWRLSATDVPEHRVVVVDIDDASLATIGPWPWPRETLATLTQKLDEQGAGLKLFDIVFPHGREGSAELSRALTARDAESPAVLAQIFALRNETRLRSGELTGAIPGLGCQAPAIPAQGFIGNAKGLHSRAGHITAVLDTDGAVRRLPALVCMDDRTYPTLALAGIDALAPLASQGGGLTVRPGTGPWSAAWELTSPVLPGITVGLDERGHLRVPYAVSREALISISAADVLQDRAPPDLLKGAWVLVGASAFGMVDAVPTALGGAVSGAEIHAQVLAAMVDGTIPHTPFAAAWLQTGYVLLSVASLLALVAGQPLRQRQRAVLLPLVAGAAGLFGFALHALALLQAGWFIGWATPALAIGLAGILLALTEHARSLVEKGRLYQNLSSYVPGPVAEQIALSEPTGDIHANRSDVTILAADLHNFSRYCEARAPEDAARVLHRFFTTASAIIEAHGGVVEEMVGDSLLAVFNGTRPCDSHPECALAASHELWLRCSEELPNTSGTGLEPLSIGIGLETGMALVGSFGSASRRVHTVLGQTVTIALRLQGLTADLAYPVLVGQEAAHRIGVQFGHADLALKPLGSFLLPGLQHSCKVFTLRTLLQPGSPADQSTLHYLRQQTHNTA
jgi:adenylate cyclase